MPSVCLVGLIAGGESGVPRYAAELANGIDRVAPEFPDLSVWMITTARGARTAAMRNLPVELAQRPFAEANAGAGRVIGEQVRSRSAPADLLHFFDLTGPIFAPRRRFVTTIHDAAVLHGFEGGRVAHKRLIQPWAARRAAAAIAVSAFARDEAVRHFGADPARIRVVHSGPGMTSGPAAAADDEPAPYILYVGNLAAHKNLPLLVRAFDDAGTDGRLLLVGGRGDRLAEVEAAIDAAERPDRIEIRRGLSDGEVDRLYRGARALALPSRYEGFGFTALEAMARGCPVIASDIPALREVSGEGAILLPLDDLRAWSDAIRRLMSEPQLRDDLRRRGSRTVERYSWEATARSVCRTFLELGER